MDPYLESRWGDVHSALSVAVRSALQPQLPRGLRARVQEEVFVDAEDEIRMQRYQPDAHVIQTGDFTGATAVAERLATVKPILVRRVPVEKLNRWVTIIDTQSHNRVVTAIEILSPSNKASGPRNKKYRQKLKDCIAGGVNIVEIDLLRSRRHKLPIQMSDLKEQDRGEYLLNVHRALPDDDVWEVYPLSLREPLQMLPIPLRETDADVPLELQPIIERIYVEGGHDDIDYSQPLDPPLKSDDATWLATLITPPANT